MSMLPMSFAAQQVVVFLVGCCVGSFLNVVIHRLPAKGSLIWPGSHCPHCRRSIAFYDNLPLLSYVILRGRCRHCHASISRRYPLVEALTGLLALLLFRRYADQSLLQFFIEFTFVALLIAITFIDLDTFTIPDRLSLTGIITGFLFSFFTPRLNWVDSLAGILIGGGFFYAVALGYQHWRHQDGLGGGDIKLLAMIGAYLGLLGVVFTILVSSIAGAVVGLAVMRRGKEGLATMLPFGPFLALGALCYLFWGEAFYEWYLGIFLGA